MQVRSLKQNEGLTYSLEEVGNPLFPCNRKVWFKEVKRGTAVKAGHITTGSIGTFPRDPLAQGGPPRDPLAPGWPSGPLCLAPGSILLLLLLWYPLGGQVLVHHVAVVLQHVLEVRVVGQVLPHDHIVTSTVQGQRSLTTSQGWSSPQTSILSFFLYINESKRPNKQDMNTFLKE